jgi:hypothetical protein
VCVCVCVCVCARARARVVDGPADSLFGVLVRTKFKALSQEEY